MTENTNDSANPVLTFEGKKYLINELSNEIKESIKDNESVFLRGFGTFAAKKRKEKTGRNISKNTTIIIPEHYIPSFKPSKSFKLNVKNNVK